jgi:Glycosyl hydrolases related to GH101 family, GH129
MTRRHALLVFASLIGVCRANAAEKPIELRLAGWSAIIEPESLMVRARIDGQPEEMAAATGSLNHVESLSVARQSASWRIPELGVTAEFTVHGNRLHARFEPVREQIFEWPRTGEDRLLSALILPEGEGLYVPLRDAAWGGRLAGKCFSVYGQLSMPFWSYRTDRQTFTYLTISDIRTELCTADKNGRIIAAAKHAFLNRDRRPAYELEMWPGGDSPIAPAIEYRDGLVNSGQFVPITEKIRANPDVAKLLGAVHMYVWGDGRSLEFVDNLRSTGINRAWIGYDQDPQTHKHLVGKRYIDIAKEAGYLVGPYDTFSNAQDSITGEDAASRWPGDLYPAGCILDQKQHPLRGFAGRGCELSSEALARADGRLKPLVARLDERLRDGANSYFLDSDAFGDLYDDYSPAHSMTAFEDRANRMRRMQGIRQRGVVLGSEEGVSWSVPVLDFAHGAISVQNAELWNKKKEFGGWWPPDRPRIFFLPVDPDVSFSGAKYDPAYRLPLYEAAFHASVVATDRWDVPMAKLPTIMKTRQLLELLYGVPSIWAMDRQQLRDSGVAIKKLVEFFEPLHRRIGTLPLSDFEWLTADRLVQRTRFGNEASLTANFGSGAFGEVKPGCVRVVWTGSGQETFCPE